MKLTAWEQFPIIVRKAWMVMRLTTLFLVITALHLSAKTSAQKITISSDGISMEQFFSQLKKQTGYSFLLENGVVPPDQKVSVHVTNATLEQVLDKILVPISLTYKVDNNIVYVQRKLTADLQSSVPYSSTPPPGIIKGKITDSLGNPLIGAFVLVEGTNKGVSTDENGEFNLRGINNNSTLIISFVGYRTRKYALAGRSEVTIGLQITNQELSQVTVAYNSGYQKIPRERSTGSFSFLSNDLINRRVGTGILDRLEGNVPGLLFNHNTVASSTGSDINIQGHSTLFSNDQPLIVIDNFAYDGDINNINPNDVESITVLKDAAAASIWGVRSGNGVIVITTKKGRQNQIVSTELNLNTTISEKPDLFSEANILDATDYINVEQKLFNLGYYDGTLSRSYGLVTPSVQIMSDASKGLISSSEAASKINILKQYDYRNDLSRYFYNRSVDQQYSLNFRGGGERSDYYISFGYDKNRTSQIGNKNDRLTLNSIVNLYPVSNLELSVGVNLTQLNTSNNSNVNTLTSLYPYLKLADNNGIPQEISTDLSIAYKDSMNNIGLLNWQLKPLSELKFSDNTTKNIDNRVNIGIKYKLLPILSVELRYQYEKNNLSIDNNYSDSTYYARNQINRFTQLSSCCGLSYPIPIGGILNETNSNSNSQQFRGQLNFQYRWKNKQELTTIAGAEVRSTINGAKSYTIYGYDKNTGNASSAINYLNYYSLNPTGSSNIPSTLAVSSTTNNFISYFANTSYSYNDLYSISVSGRIDHSNLFGVTTNQKAVPLYSAGLSYNLSNANFYKFRILPFLKIRATYGYNANINTAAAAVTTIGQYSGSTFNNLNFAQINTPGNSNLKWEKVRKINLGTDFSFIKNIIFGSIDFYFKKGIDLFGSSPLPPQTGLTTFFGNTASTKGNGYDLQLSSKLIQTKYFKWITTLIFSHAIDKVTKYNVIASAATLLGYGSGSYGTIVPKIGSPVFGLYSYKYAGLSHDNGDPQGIINRKPSTDYSTILNAASIDSLLYNGPGRPTYFGSYRNTLSYKRITLSFNIIYKFNYFFRKQSTSNVSDISTGQISNSDYLKSWKKPGDETSTNIPSIEYPPFNSNRATYYTYSSILIDKGDQIRLQDINLSYDLNIGDKIKVLKDVKAYLYLNNIGILWKENKDGIDPDNYSGPFNIKIPRTLTIGFKSNF